MITSPSIEMNPIESVARYNQNLLYERIARNQAHLFQQTINQTLPITQLRIHEQINGHSLSITGHDLNKYPQQLLETESDNQTINQSKYVDKLQFIKQSPVVFNQPINLIQAYDSFKQSQRSSQQSINQALKHSINQSTIKQIVLLKQTVNQFMQGDDPIIQISEQSISENWRDRFDAPYGEKPSVIQTSRKSPPLTSINQSTDPSANQSTNQLINQSLNQNSQSNNQPNNQSSIPLNNQITPASNKRLRSRTASSPPPTSQPINQSIVASTTQAVCEDCGSRIVSLLDQCSVCGHDPLESDGDVDETTARKRRKKRAAKLESLFNSQAINQKKAQKEAEMRALAAIHSPW